MSYYVKATGNNRFAGGTSRWLRIRNITVNNNIYTLEVRFKDMKYFVDMTNTSPPKYLKFAKDWPALKPISFMEVIK